MDNTVKKTKSLTEVIKDQNDEIAYLRDALSAKQKLLKDNDIEEIDPEPEFGSDEYLEEQQKKIDEALDDSLVATQYRSDHPDGSRTDVKKANPTELYLIGKRIKADQARKTRPQIFNFND